MIGIQDADFFGNWRQALLTVKQEGLLSGGFSELVLPKEDVSRSCFDVFNQHIQYILIDISSGSGILFHQLCQGELSNSFKAAMPGKKELLHPLDNDVLQDRIFPIIKEHAELQTLRDRLSSLKVSFTCRLKCNDDTYQWFVCQLTIAGHTKTIFQVVGVGCLTCIDGIKKNTNIELKIAVRENGGHYEEVYKNAFPLDEPMLSDRELQILKLVADGYTSKEIASMLFLSAHTVNNHRKNMLKKMKVNSMSELIAHINS